MRRPLPSLQTFLLAAVAALLALALPTSALAAPNVAIGIEQPGNMEDPHYLPIILDTQRGMGAQVIRYYARFNVIAAACDPASAAGGAPASSPDNRCYDWTTMDNVVRGAEARGMRVLLSTYGTPAWMFDGPMNYTGTTDAQYERFATAMADFTQAAATRFDGRHGLPRVEQWTIWNEPNGSFFEPRRIGDDIVAPRRYARLYDLSARRIKAVDPTLRVAVGPTAPHAPALPPVKFISMTLPLLQALGSPIDAWAHNAYMGPQDPYHTTIKPPYIGLGNLKDLTALLDAYALTRGKPIWVTEFGYQTEGAQKAVNEDRQAELTASVLKFVHEEPRLETFLWYQLHDDDPTGLITSFQSGLFHEDAKVCDGGFCPKPAAGVFRHTLWIGPVRGGKVSLWGQGRMQPSATRIYVRASGDAGWQAYGNPDTATTGTVKVTIPWTAGMQAMTCDVRCGVINEISDAVTGGGDAPGEAAGRVVVEQLPAIRLDKRSALAYGIFFDVNCTGCTVRSRITAKGAVSRVAAARNKPVIVARSKMAPRPKNRVTLRFTKAAKQQLAPMRSTTVTLRIYIAYANGTKAVSDRLVTLR